MKSLVFFFLFLALWLPAQAQETTKKAGFRLSQWTDIHAGGRFYSESAFSEACRRGLDSQPQGVLITGDFCDNSYDLDGFSGRLRESLHLIANKVRKYPGPVFLAVGNDDLRHNYQTPPADMAETMAAFREAWGPRCYLDELGNGVSPNHLGGLNWVSINSIIFSYKNNDAASAGQARRTLAWLRQQMPPAATKEDGTRVEDANPAPGVVIVTHLPPAWDFYLNEPSWKLQYLREFQEIISRYPGQVIVLAGHYHRNHIQAIERGEGNEPTMVLTAGALATKFGYHSNWRELSVRQDEDGRVESISYTVRYPGKSQWDSNYLVNPRKLNDLFEAITTSEPLYRRYMADIFGHHVDYLDQVAQGKLKERLVEQFWLHTNALEPAEQP